MMKLSIIVPVYNAEKYLEQCLGSLVKQELSDYEVILINDGSGDSSPEIMERFRASYPEIIKTLSVENGGQGRARNIGIDMARGEYIGFVDSDDWVSPQMFGKMYEKAVSEKADILICDAYNCYSDGREEYFPISQYVKPIKMDTAVWNKLYKRELIGNIRFPEGKLWYEDLDFVVRTLIKADRLVRLPEALYYYRIGQVSTMNNNNAAKNLDIIKIMEGLSKVMLPQYREDFESLIINHILLDTLNRVSLQNNDEKDRVLKELGDYVRRYIPKLGDCAAFREESRNRRIIMQLNYMGLASLSKFILKLKSSI